METRGLTRREAIRLLGASSVAGGVLLGLGTSALADESPPGEAQGVVGVIRATADAHISVESRDGWFTARPAHNARMYSGVFGRVSRPSDFIVGDRVLVQGEPKGQNMIHASQIGSVYDVVDFTVLSVDPLNRRAQTTLGPLDLSGALPDVGIVAHALRANDTLRGLSWTDPRSGQQFLVLTERDRLS